MHTYNDHNSRMGIETFVSTLNISSSVTYNDHNSRMGIETYPSTIFATSASSLTMTIIPGWELKLRSYNLCSSFPLPYNDHNSRMGIETLTQQMQTLS